MRYVIYTDERGWKRRAMLRDSDGDEMARYGLPAGPPDVNIIDLEALLRNINNSLVEHGLFTWGDVNHSALGLNVANVHMKRALESIFKDQERTLKES